MRTYEVYKITNKVTNKIYIGITNQGSGARYRHHWYEARTGEPAPIHKSMAKYGEDNFTLEVIDFAENAEELKEKEKYYIKFFNSKDRKIGYNLTDGGDGSLGRIPSEETREKIRKAHIGMKVPYKSRSHINTKGEKNPFYGRTHTEETRNRISKANTGRKHTEEAVINMKKAKKDTPVGSENKSSKKIINTKTNEIYGCALDVLPIVNISISRFRGYLNLNSKIKNPTYFMYLEDYEKYGALEPEIVRINCNKVIDIVTNITYNSVKDCGLELNIKYEKLTNMLKGKIKNITNLRYLKDI